MAADAAPETDAALREKLLADVERIRPLLEAQAPEHEKRGWLGEDVTKALDEIGAFRLLLPKRLGGLCVPAAVMAEVGVAVSRACPTAGWLVTVMNSASWVASKAPKRMQDAIFANGPARLCASTNGAGTIKKVGEDFIVNGKWAYGSGCRQSEWACCPVVGEDGAVYDAALPMSAMRIDNTWHVAGMQGTGSDTLVADNVVVKPEWFCTMAELWGNEGKEDFNELSDRWTLWPLMRAKLMNVLIGTAYSLFDAVVAGKEKPIMYTTYAKRVDSSVYQMRAGEIRARIRTAEILMDHMLRRLDEAAEQNIQLGYAECAEMRGLVAVSIDTLIEQVDKLMSMAGSSAFADANPIQRLWRDFSAASRHIVFHSDSHYEVYGRQLLGVEPNIVALETV